MDRYETYRSNAAEAPIMRRWLFAALVLSLVIHGIFFYYAYRKQIHGFVPANERLTPPIVVSMKRVAIPKMDEPTQTTGNTPDKKPSAQAKVEIPSEKPQVGDVQVAPQITTLPKQLLNEKPKVDIAGLDQLNKDLGNKSAMEKELNAVASALLKESQRSIRQPTVAVGGGGPNAGGGAGDASVNIPGMASIDQALSGTAPLKTGGKIGVQGGALFEYDSFELKPESVELLQKLGTLIQSNPRATFSIEGHTDSFGGPEYNQTLSLKRAESVKAWLVDTMHIAPDRIQTRGLGNTRPLVPSDRSKEEQAPNRRVEIVVKNAR